MLILSYHVAHSLIHDGGMNTLKIPRPPAHYIELIGGSGFEKIGEDFCGYFKTYGGLLPQATVLEIGCGVGRMAIPLTRFLKGGGCYYGIDILPEFIDWNQANITPHAPNFTFIHADIKNTFYHPKGAIDAADYTFPFAECSFDFIFLVSVFTHMLEAGFVRYISEISRMLKSGGRCLATFFLLNAHQKKLRQQGKNTLHFPIDHGKCKSMAGELELAVSYAEEFVRETCQQHGMPVKDPVYYGSWSGRNDYLTYQDLLIMEKQ